MIIPYGDEYFMRKAIEVAKKGYELDEIPIGAVVVANNFIIAKGHNLTEQLNDVTAHAEMISITAAVDNLGGKYLKNCTLYVTLEPCVMCAGALYWSQITRIVFGANDNKRGSSRYGSLFHPSTEIIGGVLANECEELIKTFFEKKRS